MTQIKKPAFAPIRQLSNQLKGTAPSSPAPSQVTGGWLPKVIKTPQPSEAMNKAAYAAADAVKGGLKKGLETTKAVNEATAGPRSNSKDGYKYQGVIEVSLEALNRTFEGGGVDVKKGVKFVQDNAKKK